MANTPWVDGSSGGTPISAARLNDIETRISAAAAAAAAAKEPFTPQAYGAVGDGVADDGPAITACITAALAAIPASNAGGAFSQAARVRIPAGRYRIATPVVVNLANSSNADASVRRRLTLEGDGDGHTVILGQTAANTYALNLRGGQLTLTGMGFIGNGTATSYLLNLGADNAEASPFINQFRISEVTFRDAGRFVNLTWAFDGQFSSCGFSNLAAGGIGVNVPTHSTDNCNNINFIRCHWEPALAGGTFLKVLGVAGTASRSHAVFGFQSCHFESRSFGTRLMDLEAVDRVSFTACQFSQNSDPGNQPAASGAVPAIRLVHATQVSFTSSSIMRDPGTGWTTKLLALGGRNSGLSFQSCFFFPGDGAANAGKAAVWASDTATAYIAGVTPFRLVATNIGDNTAAAVPNEIVALMNPNTAAEMWTQRFDPTSKQQVFGYGAAGGDWASGRDDRMAFARDGGLVVGSYLAASNQRLIANGASSTFTMSADNNANRIGVYLVCTDHFGPAYALVHSTGGGLTPISVGDAFVVGNTDPGTVGKVSLYLGSNGALAVTNRTGMDGRVSVLPLLAFT